MSIITLARAKELFRYEPTSGKVYWRTGKMIGREAGTFAKNNHRQISVDGRAYRAHRIIWLLATGRWPEGDIDHINGNPADNSLSNLRDVPHVVNQRNLKARRSVSGVQGVYWHPTARKWCARIMVDRRNLYLGLFDHIDDARAARSAAEAKHGFHANHGRAPA